MTLTLPRRVALGTMHGKEAAIAPPLAALGIALTRAVIDTDRFGTFSSEVTRTGTMLDAARAKARAAAEATGLPVAIASEGAYGPHPHMPFLPLGQEILLWLDTRSGREIVEHVTDPATNYDQCHARTLPEAESFLTRIGFPATAVIVAPTMGAVPVAKGLRDPQALAEAMALASATSGRAFLQTDMRAHMNPHRIAVIAGLARRLAARLATPCPDCTAAGFGRDGTEPGLPCGDCGTPTALVAADLLCCTACGFHTRQPRSGQADPAHCPHCNP